MNWNWRRCGYGVLVGLVAVVSATAAVAQQPEEKYPDHPDSLRKPGVPEGKIVGPVKWVSQIFPGTERSYWVYVPAQYDAAKPAALMVLQDGLGLANSWKAPVAFDNLIHEGAMPVTIGVFVSPGVVPAPHEKAQPRFNRSFEYDGLGDRYARFLAEEILPEVRKTYAITDDPNLRAIGGSSSGAIAAFTAAWERPDLFRRVFSSIGTYVSLRGGNEYPVLIRKHEPKPLRVFLQDGSADNDIYAGSWWVANQDMLAALKWHGYAVNHVWGTGGHNGKHAAAIFPDALRWLWKDHGQPIEPAKANARIEILIPGEEWKLVSEGHKFTEGPAVSPSGELYFSDVPGGKIHKIGLDGQASLYLENLANPNGLMFGPDGKLYSCQKTSLVRYTNPETVETLVSDTKTNDLCVLRSGDVYYTDPENKTVWHVSSKGERRAVDKGLEFPNGLICSADQTLMFVADTRGRFVYSYQIQADGTLAHKQPYGWLHLTDDAGPSGADGMTVDTEGRLYVTTRAGLQVLDQLGRVHYILKKPAAGWLSNVVFAGPNLDVLYVTCGDQVFSRKMNAKGVAPSRDPVVPPKPRL